jgi:hypothetical protein
MGKKDQRTIDDLYEVMEAILKEQQMIKKLLESNHAPATQAQTSQRVFPKGKYKGKTPAQVLDIEPSYIEFIYKTYILQQNAHSADWSMVTEDHYNAALSRGAGGRTPGSGMTTGAPARATVMDEEDAPPPSKKKKPVPKPPEFLGDDIPF